MRARTSTSGRSRLRTGDLLSEALTGILARPGRTALTLVGIVLGIGAFVSILGLTSSATGQISQRFTTLAATEVTVEDLTANDPAADGAAFPDDAEARIAAINGVRHAGTYWVVPGNRTGVVTGIPLAGPATTDQVPVVAASPGLFAALHATIGHGRAFDSVLDRRAERVVVVGGMIAGRLGIRRLDVRPAIFINGAPFTVIGVVTQTERRPELLAAVWVPRGTAEKLWPGPADPSQPPQMVIDTGLGAANVVAMQAPVALRPDAPKDFHAIAPPDPRQLRDSVNTDLSGLFLVLASISLAVGAIGIANTTLVAVLERVPEIGLRRALGARRRHIAMQFLTESTCLGLIGGISAAGLGVAVVVTAAIGRHWTPIIAPWTVLAAPALGAGAGLVSGLYPAIRASRIQPVAALRQQA